jgi:preprotein translocase subunit SecA
MLKSLARFLGGSNESVIKKLKSDVEDINALEPEVQRLTDEQLHAKTEEFRQRYLDGESLDDLLYEAFAVVREASIRTLGQRHYDVQLMGGIVLHDGKIAEMRTGEGKTLVATLPTYLNALSGKGVHVITVNDYLARRDAQWMGRIYDFLGMSIGILQHDASFIYDSSVEDEDSRNSSIRRVERRDAYAADITYGTNNEFGFDYLRDNMVADLSRRAQRELAFAIVDEVDNILIDEARTPLIISGPAQSSPQDYYRVARVVPNLTIEEDYTIDEKHKSVALTGEGITRLEKLLNVNNLYAPENFEIVHFVENAVKAAIIFQRDRDYVVQNNEVIIVDEFTGRLMQGRRYSDGLHQALEAKEGVKVQRESITYATITLQNYFRIYDKLAGMTGTAVTEAEEFFKIYKLEVVEIPTNKPTIRGDQADQIYKDEKTKFRAVVRDIKELHRKGLPVLVGTTDIDKSELLADMLKREGVPHEVLNAKQHEREAMIIAQAGRPGSVTVATNMAGRGTDIILGGNPESLNIPPEEWQADHNRIVELGGLHIVGTERHEARRIDNQLRGRAGRQGDPGVTRFYVALDDELMRRFGGDRIKAVMEWAGLDEDTPIENKMISKSIENAQVKVEAYHFDIRKHLVEYDDVVNTHRDIIYGERDKILRGADLKTNVQSMIEKEITEVLNEYLQDRNQDNWDTEGLIRELTAILPLPGELLDPDDLADMDREEIEDRLHDHAIKLYEDMEDLLTPEETRRMERQVMLQVIDQHWVQHLTSMENLRQGIGLHAFGQRDPLVMYKKEGYDSFQTLQSRMQHDIVHNIYRLGGMVQEHQAANGGKPAVRNRQASSPTSIMANVVGTRREAVPGGASKVGRNAPCPCGSGKKYKRCCGKAA